MNTHANKPKVASKQPRADQESMEHYTVPGLAVTSITSPAVGAPTDPNKSGSALFWG